ncbi:uncharacterized protein LOC130258937 [Oenanthe melanoleuca]|uniref:uncharacterized protein LOC130258937 n=1 Tax=Oenanthe melanoleuca TaxID=2939378 RepID=UPI0024C1F7B8|nr:uncharacterized protein LOC130258937 [Oenanthe melanoleuca]
MVQIVDDFGIYCIHDAAASTLRWCDSHAVSTSLKVIQPPAALLRSRGLWCSAERGGSHRCPRHRGQPAPPGFAPPGLCAASPRRRERALVPRAGRGGPGGGGARGVQGQRPPAAPGPPPVSRHRWLHPGTRHSQASGTRPRIRLLRLIRAGPGSGSKKNKDFLKPLLCISAELPRLAPTSCPSDNGLQGNSNANLEPDFSMGLYFCSSTRIRAFGSQPAGAARMQSQSRTVGHFPFTSPFLTVILLPLVLVLLIYMQMTSRARKNKGGHMDLCE